MFFRLPIVKFFSRILNRITITVVLVALPGVVILGVLAALWQRVKEIQKGEADDAKQY